MEFVHDTSSYNDRLQVVSCCTLTGRPKFVRCLTHYSCYTSVADVAAPFCSQMKLEGKLEIETFYEVAGTLPFSMVKGLAENGYRPRLFFRRCTHILVQILSSHPGQ